jgi:hypothetical protein
MGHLDTLEFSPQIVPSELPTKPRICPLKPTTSKTLNGLFLLQNNPKVCPLKSTTSKTFNGQLSLLLNDPEVRPLKPTTSKTLSGLSLLQNSPKLYTLKSPPQKPPNEHSFCFKIVLKSALIHA